MKKLKSQTMNWMQKKKWRPEIMNEHLKKEGFERGVNVLNNFYFYSAI